MTKINRYAELKIQEKAIQTELKEIKAEVTAFVLDADDEKVETDFGSFELRNGTKKWKYSDALTLTEKQAKEAIKSKKVQEELNGSAELLKAPTNLIFTMKKGK